MTEITFYDQLNGLIQASGLSKNCIIKKTGIDRSSFFQILGGRRAPTEQQFGALLRVLSEIDPNPFQSLNISEDALLESYLPLRLNEEDMAQWKLVRTFISEVNAGHRLPSSWNRNAPDTPAEYASEANDTADLGRTISTIQTFLADELSAPHSRLDFYVSAALQEKLEIDRLLGECLPSEPRVRQIVNVQRNNVQGLTEKVLQNVSRLIRVTSGRPQCLQIYSSDDSDESNDSQLFPYYMIGSSQVLLISPDGTETASIRERSLVRTWQHQFEATIRRLEPMYASVDNYLVLARDLFKLVKEIRNGSLISAAERPCTLQLVNPAIVKKYLHDPLSASFANAYIHSLQAIPQFCYFMTRDGLNAFEQDHIVSEAGMNFHLDESDMEDLNAALRRILGVRELVVPFHHVVIHDWEIAIYGEDTVFLTLHASTDCVIRLTNPHVVHALYLYYDSFRRILVRKFSDVTPPD